MEKEQQNTYTEHIPPIISPEQHRLFLALREKYREIGIDASNYFMAFNERINDLTDKLREKNPEFRKYYLFHIIAGSTVSNNQAIDFFDFDGELSIEKFINQEYQDFKNQGHEHE